MAYKKKYRRRPKRKSEYALAKKALKKVNKIQKSIERKHHDLDITGPINIDWNPQLANLNVIPVGTSDTTRIGDKVQMTGLRSKIHIDLNTVQEGIFRCIVMYDKFDKITSSTDFLEIEGIPNGIESPYDVDTRGQYIILHDKVYSMSNGSNRIKYINLSKKLNKGAHWEGGSTIATKGVLRFWLFSDTSDLLVTKPQWYGYSRVYYEDL